MTTMSVIFNLAEISTSGGMYVYDGVPYAVVVAGSPSHCRDLVVSLVTTDNALLVDDEPVLGAQFIAPGGTYMAGNAMMCMDSPSVVWSQRSDSYLSYNVSQARA